MLFTYVPMWSTEISKKENKILESMFYWMIICPITTHLCVHLSIFSDTCNSLISVDTIDAKSFSFFVQNLFRGWTYIVIHVCNKPVEKQIQIIFIWKSIHIFGYLFGRIKGRQILFFGLLSKWPQWQRLGWAGLRPGARNSI